MNPALLHPDIQNYIRSFEGEVTSLALKGSPFQDVSTKELIQQIEGYQKTEKKLPTWHKAQNIYYPEKLSIEQSSSESTAAYKATLVQGETLADITGGFGVDSFYFAHEFSKVFHFETQKTLSKIAAHNFKLLGKSNMHCSNKDGLKAIASLTFDVIYIDPARRHDAKGKVFLLSDCTPNVVDLQDYLLDRCQTLLIKTSPMLDIAAGIKALNHITEIHIVAYRNEVKELLWLLNRQSKKEITIKTVNILPAEQQEFSFNHLSTGTAAYSLPQKYLYEPNAALLKSGGFSEISAQLQLPKLAPHSHLYTADTLFNFPGRVFTIEKVIPYKKKEMREYIAGSKANVTTRNFSETVAQLRKKWNITDGGNRYLFFTKNINNDKIVLECSKLNI